MRMADASVRTLDAASEAAWDRFVIGDAGGTFFHRAGWAKVIETAFGHRTHFSFAERDGAITGVLPLAGSRPCCLATR